jgi:hypothetical protein
MEGGAGREGRNVLRNSTSSNCSVFVDDPAAAVRPVMMDRVPSLNRR